MKVNFLKKRFRTCPAERRASPGERGPQIAPFLRELGQEAGISASRSIPRICPLPCCVREFSSRMLVLPSVAVRDGSYYEFWVYILTSRTGTLYVGVTGYLGTRIMQHKIDSIEGFTKKYKVHRLVYYESYEHVMTPFAARSS
jgi:hypothetical protein